MNMNNIFGLQNNGNTCYQNAALQSLLCIDKLNDILNNKKLLKKILKNYIIETDEMNELILSFILYVFLNEEEKIRNPKIIPECIKNYKIKYNNKITQPYKNEFPKYEQLDSYEYLNVILSILHKELQINFLLNSEDLNNIKENIEKNNNFNNEIIEYNKENIIKYSILQFEKVILDGYSLINQIFSGQYINITECENCSYKNFSFTYSDTLDLDLFNSENNRLFNDLYECLDNQMNINLYSDENIHKKNTGHLRCYSYYKFFDTPQVLIIRLKRFNDKSKINHSINIPLSLNISKYIHMFSNKKNNCNYNLISAVIHSGGLNGGHYFAIGKKNNYWLNFNDSTVSIINPNNLNNYLSKSYILFYQLI